MTNDPVSFNGKTLDCGSGNSGSIPETGTNSHIEILRGLIGSSAYGISSDNSDRDEMGVFIEYPENVCGLVPFEHFIYRTQPEGVRSGAGDLDLTMYSLRKFVRLAEVGNPTIVALLWLPKYLYIDDLGRKLVDMRHAFVSQESGKRFLGYLIAQKKRMTGELSRTVNRPDLVDKYGYDTKFAMHALRLGLEGVQYMTEGRLEYPITGINLQMLRDVRHGEVTFSQALDLINWTEDNLRRAIDKNKKATDTRVINQFLVDMHFEAWGR